MWSERAGHHGRQALYGHARAHEGEESEAIFVLFSHAFWARARPRAAAAATITHKTRAWFFCSHFSKRMQKFKVMRGVS